MIEARENEPGPILLLKSERRCQELGFSLLIEFGRTLAPVFERIAPCCIQFSSAHPLVPSSFKLARMLRAESDAIDRQDCLAHCALANSTSGKTTTTLLPLSFVYWH